MVRGFNAAQEVLITDGRKVQLRFPVTSLLRLGAEHNRIAAILDVDEKQNSGLLIAKASDLVFTGGECLAGGHERKRYLHEDLIRGLGLRRDAEASEANQHQEYAQE